MSARELRVAAREALLTAVHLGQWPAAETIAAKLLDDLVRARRRDPDDPSARAEDVRIVAAFNTTASIMRQRADKLARGPVTFVGLRGKVYDPADLRTRLMRELRAVRDCSAALAEQDQRSAVASAWLADEERLRWFNGMTPGAAVREIVSCVLGGELRPGKK